MKEFIKRYFIEQNEIPSGTQGFAWFGWAHIAWLMFFAVLAVAIVLIMRRQAGNGRRRTERLLGLSILALNLVRAAFLIIKGQYGIGYLPLHLCGMSVYIEAADAVFPNRLTRELCWALCMPGAFMALLMPDWKMYEPFVFYPSLCFLLHGLLVVYPLVRVLAGACRPCAGNLWMCAAFIAAVGTPVYFLNKLWHTNFMFTNWAPAGTPLEWFERAFGTPGYLLGFPIMLAAVWLVLYAPFANNKITDTEG